VILSTRRPASRLATPVLDDNGSNGQPNSVVLGPKDRLVGQLFIEGDLRVSGTVDGTLEATGDIEISGAGKVNGDVTAYNRLTVGADASLVAGEVRVARLTVQDGAVFSGKVSMGKRVASEPKASKPEPQPEPAAAAAPEPQAIEIVVAQPEPLKKGRRR
jgi:cytoskeletal protein CcmA (bactofilin family)